MPSFRLASVVMALLTFGVHATPVQAQPLPAEVMNKAKSNCLTSVAKPVNRPRSSLQGIKASRDASGARVEIQVPTAQAPWTCLTNPKGEVETVTFN
ncbi:MAG: hypothetical protein ACKO0M_01995 [Cyanobium sp.]